MISKREFMAGSVALAAWSASTRPAPEPESICVNDIHSQLNPNRVLGISQPRSREDVQSLVRAAQRSAIFAGGLKSPRSRYVPVRRNFAVFCAFGVSKNQ